MPTAATTAANCNPLASSGQQHGRQQATAGVVAAADFVVSRQMSTTHDKLRTTEAPMQHVCGDATNAIIDINSFQSAGYGYFFPSIELLAVVAPKVLQQPWQQR